MSFLRTRVFGLSRTCNSLSQRNTSSVQRVVSRSYAFPSGQTELLNQHLKDCDPEIHDIIEREKCRQRDSIVLIPSENFTSRSVMDALGSVMQNKYSEGYPGQRYYGGNEYIDMAETLCQKRALEAFDLDPAKWGVNVQALSGAPANLYVYYGLMKPHERLMGLDLPHGGHLSHGYQTASKKISAVSAYFETMPYRVDEKTGYIDYDALEKSSLLYHPKVIVAGASAYPRNYDYRRMKEIAANVKAYLVSDMAHISGLVAARVLPSPFEYSDVVTTTTHKSLRGPRGALIFFRKGVQKVDKKGSEILYDLEDKINFSVFPGHQGGPHNHTITALAVALKQAKTPLFREYQQQVLDNAQAFGSALQDIGFDLVSKGTDTHLLLIDLRSQGIDGARVERILELANVAANKNTVPGDKSALVPGGLRVGTPAMTTRGFTPADFSKVAGIIHKALTIAKMVDTTATGTKYRDFQAALGPTGSKFPEISDLKNEVIDIARRFPVIGFEREQMKYHD